MAIDALTTVVDARRTVDALPNAITEALKGAAIRIAGKVETSAKRNLLAETHSDKTPESAAERTADAIHVELDVPNKTAYVISPSIAGDPANNPIWLEHGTVHQAPKPYMRPAGQEHEAEYQREVERALEETLRVLNLL